MYPVQEKQTPYYLFYSYAEEDAYLVAELDKQLKTLERLGEIKCLHKRKISPGEDWQQQIERYMNRASIILLLVSRHFIASDQHFDREMAYALKRRNENKAYIIPIMLRPGDYQKLEFGIYETLPSNGKAVTKWSDRDAAFEDIAQGISRAVQNLRDFDALRAMSPIDPLSYHLPSILPPKEPPKQRSTPKRDQDVLQPSQVKTTKPQKRKAPGSQRAAQTAVARRPELQMLPAKRSSFFSSQELDIYLRGRNKDLFKLVLLLCVVFDVLGLAILSSETVQ